MAACNGPKAGREERALGNDPVITGFSPASGGQGVSVTITGVHFTGATEVRFNSQLATGFTVNSDTQITAAVPAGALSGSIRVRNASGESGSGQSFTVLSAGAPTLSGFSPTSGAPGSYTIVDGTNFTGVTQVLFNGMPSSGFGANGDTQLFVYVPEGATTGKITVVNTIGQVVSANDFSIAASPVVSSFNPASGKLGDSITITGQHFTGVNQIFIGGKNASFTIQNDSTITTTVPNGAVTGKVQVLNAQAPTDFIVLGAAAPTVSSFSPGSAGAGSEVKVVGTNFTGLSAAKFNGVDSPNVWVETDTVAHIYVPMGASTGKIAMVNSVGTGLSATNFVVPAPPTVTSFSPSSATAGAAVVITGTGFTGVGQVQFSQNRDATFVVNSDTQITAYVPLGAQNGPITVGGVASTTSFTVLSSAAPTISTFSPTSGSIGSPVDVYGTHFTGVTAAAINGVQIDVHVESDTRLGFNVPAGASTGKVTVINTVGSVDSVGVFTVTASPTISGFTPTSGAAGTQVTITGQHFTGVSYVQIGNGEQASFTVDSDTQITATVPSGTSSGQVRVGPTYSQGMFNVLSTAPPTISSFSPSGGGVGTHVIIVGTNFGGTTDVQLNGQSMSFWVQSATQLNVDILPGATTGKLKVVNTQGNAVSINDFVVPPAPTVTSFSPSSGKLGDVVTITGTGFTGVAQVQFNGRDASFTVVSPTQINAVVPAGAMSGKLRVAGVDSPGSFTVVAVAAPTISGFTPSTGSSGTEVSIAGTNFTGISGVSFNGVPSENVWLESDTQLRAIVPKGASTGKITVSNTVGSAQSVADFVVPPPPTVSGFTPTSGKPGDTVVITGTGFGGVGSVRFGGAAGTFTVDSPTQITVTVPVGAASGPIEVGGVLSAASFTVLSVAAPTVSGFSPGSGGRDTYVEIVGANFTGATEVRFGGTSASSFMLQSDNYIYAHVPSGATTGPITVVNTVGSGASATNFVVVPEPAVSGFTPTSGPSGTQVVVTGSGFSGATQVTLVNGQSGTTMSFTVDSDTQITATVPVGASSGHIHVKAPGGESDSFSTFTVTSSAAPTVSGFTPTSGGTGVVVTINGTHFTGTTAVDFNGAAASFTVVSDTQLSATVPSGATSGPVHVTNTVGSATSAGSFTVVPPPAITDFNPKSGVVGTSVVITGTQLGSVNKVSFGNGDAVSFTVDSPTQITAQVPASATSGPVQVSAPSGTGSSAVSFTLLAAAAPTVSGFNPSSGGPNDVVLITGSGFAAATTVRFNGVDAFFAVEDDGKIHVTVPAGATTGPISVTNNIGTGTSAGSFTIVPPPTVSGFSPSSGAPGTVVTITGTDFTSVQRVSFGSTDTQSFSVNSPTQITVAVPAGAATGPISVRTSGGKATSAASFTVVAAVAPTVSSFSPASGPVGTLVIVSGTDFTAVTAVRFNGTPVAFFQAGDDGKVLYTLVPAGATSGKISVVNAAGTGQSAASFTVGAGTGPVITQMTPTAGPIGTTVVVTGSNLGNVGGIQLGQGSAQPIDNTPTSVTFKVPLGATTDFVFLSTGTGYAISPVKFFVGPAPTVTSFSPGSGLYGDTVTLHGRGFTGTTQVSFGGMAASQVTIDSDLQITVVVPVGATTGNISVTNPSGTGQSASSFTVTSPPVDMSTPPDLSTLPDMSTPPDLSTPADLAMADMAGAIDMATPPADMATPPADMAMAPADMAMAPADMAMAPGDMAMAPGDMAVGPTDMAGLAPDLASPMMESSGCSYTGTPGSAGAALALLWLAIALSMRRARRG